MPLQSKLPTDVSPALRLREYLNLVQDLSRAAEPEALIRSFRSRSRFVVAADHTISLSRRGMRAGSTRITRSTRWTEPINPWQEPHRLPIVSRGMLPRLVEAGQPVKIDELEVEPDDPFAEHAGEMRSLLAAPIYHEGEPLYMVILMRAEPNAFTLDELCTLVLTSNLIGRATSHLVLADQLQSAYAALDREFEQVGRIQRQLLPAELPKIPGVTVATHYETSRRAGGDYYDFFLLPEQRWGFLIADVSGHGPAAAVVMAMMRSLLRSPLRMCPNLPNAPTQMLAMLNGELAASVSPGQFITAFAGVYDPARRTLRYANAGHNPPRWLRGEHGAVVPLESAKGLPLAITEPFDGADSSITVEPGDRILLYTDGITETFNRGGDMFGTEGLDAVLHCCSRTPANLIAAINGAVQGFAAGAPVEDDRTLVAIAFD